MTTNEETCSPCAPRGVAPVMVCEQWGDGWRDIAIWTRPVVAWNVLPVMPWRDGSADDRVCLPHMPSGGAVTVGMQWWLQ